MYPFHLGRASALDQDRRDGKHSINFWARGLLKTTMVSVARNIQFNLLHPHSSAMLRHYDEDLIQEVLAEIVAHYTQNPLFRFYFPEHAVPMDRIKEFWSGEYFESPVRKNLGLPFRRAATFFATGLQSTQQSIHFDYISDDDIEIDKAVATDLLRDKLERKWSDTAALLNPRRQLPNGMWVGLYQLVGTFWHEDGLYARMCQNLRTESSYHFHIHPAREGQTDNGKPICPEVLSEEKLREKRATSTDYYTYSCNYLLKPAYREGGAFQPDQWPRWPKRPERSQIGLRVMSLDPAFTAVKKNDPSGIVVVDILPDDTWVVLCAYRVWMEPHELVPRVWDLHDEYRPDLIYVETMGTGFMLGKAFEESMAERGRHLPLEAVKFHQQPNKSEREKKGKTRIGALKHRAFKSKLALYEGGYGISDLIAEVEAYPYGRHDDLLDALATIEEQTPAHRPQEKEPDQAPEGSLAWLLQEEDEEDMQRVLKTASWRRDPQAITQWLEDQGRREFGGL